MKITRRQLKKMILNEMKPFYGKAQEPRFFSPGSILAPGGFSLGSQPLVPPSMDFLRGRNYSLEIGPRGFSIYEGENEIVNPEELDQLLRSFPPEFQVLDPATNEVDGERLIDMLHKAASSKGGKFEVDSEVLEELGIVSDDGDDI